MPLIVQTYLLRAFLPQYLPSLNQTLHLQFFQISTGPTLQGRIHMNNSLVGSLVPVLACTGNGHLRRGMGSPEEWKKKTKKRYAIHYLLAPAVAEYKFYPWLRFLPYFTAACPERWEIGGHITANWKSGRYHVQIQLIKSTCWFPFGLRNFPSYRISTCFLDDRTARENCGCIGPSKEPNPFQKRQAQSGAQAVKNLQYFVYSNEHK